MVNNYHEQDSTPRQYLINLAGVGPCFCGLMWFSTTAGRLYGNTDAGFGLESHGEMLMSAAVLQCKEKS